MKNRIFGLDLVRTIAILSVLMSHSNDLLPNKLEEFLNSITVDGVSIFFVLSGFLIGGIILKDLDKYQLDWKYLKYFWNRRWLRTLPNYFLVLLFLFLYSIIQNPKFDWVGVLPYFVFSQNLLFPHPNYFFPEAWSLSIEEWFYLLFPILLLVFSRFSNSIHSGIVYTAISMISISFVFRILKLSECDYLTFEWIDNNIRKIVISRFDGLFIGVIGAYFLKFKQIIFYSRSTLKFLFGIIIFVISEYLRRYSFEPYIVILLPTIYSISIMLMFPKIIQFRSPNKYFNSFVLHTSLISYSLYLINLFTVKRFLLKIELIENLPFGQYFQYFLFWALNFLVASLMYAYFEKPILKFRKEPY